MEVENCYSAGWKINENDEACYIDIEVEDSINDINGNQDSGWANLPDLLLEDIFSYLNIRERYYVSMVCKNWYRAFFLPNVWRNFLVVDDTLSRKKFNFYSGWQPVLDHMRTQNCLSKIGRFIKGLDFRPDHTFSNMYQFMTLLTYCMQQNRSRCMLEYVDVGRRIRSLTYLFPCNMATIEDSEHMKLFGTGGELLTTLKSLLAQLTNLKSLKLIDLNLERFEANHLLDEIVDSCGLGLKNLYLVNSTLTHCPIMHVGLFFNLNCLVISPQNLDDDVLQLLTSTRLKYFHILQNKYTPIGYTKSPCTAKAWKSLRQGNPSISVYLRVESLSNAEIIMQPDAPVHSISYRTQKTQITSEKLLQIIDSYKYTLTIFGHETVPKFESARAFHDRIDSIMLLMARNCYNLTTLMIRENIATSTLLMIAKTAQNLRHFHVLKSAVITECKWPKNPEWTEDYFMWLQMASQTINSTEREISQILGYRWKLLTDEQFEKIKIDTACNV